MYDGSKVSFGGRTANTNFPMPLLTLLQETFTVEKFRTVFEEIYPVVLFGEGYGGCIQKKAGYGSDVSFILFDCVINGWWLEYENRLIICNRLGIRHVPKINNWDYVGGAWNIESIVEFVKSKPKSFIPNVQETIIEGIVARAVPQMLFRKPPIICDDPLTYADYHVPIMFKLKVKDYE